MLLDEARSRISQYATAAWIAHSPLLVVGMEDGLRKLAAMEALAAKQVRNYHSIHPLCALTAPFRVLQCASMTQALMTQRCRRRQRDLL